MPAFDNYLIGYKDRTAIVDPELHGRVYQGGWIQPTVLVDGRVVGTWALERSKGKVRVSPFAPLSRSVRDEIDGEIDDLARFLGRELDAVVES
jgi:hypothetical protein